MPKYLIQDGTDIFRYTTVLEDIGDVPVTKSMFDTYGMDNLNNISRTNKTFNYNVTSSSALGTGRVFSKAIDLKKMIDIVNIVGS